MGSEAWVGRWAMLGRQGLREALPWQPGLSGKDTRGRKKETNKTSLPSSCLRGQALSGPGQGGVSQGFPMG